MVFIPYPMHIIINKNEMMILVKLLGSKNNLITP